MFDRLYSARIKCMKFPYVLRYFSYVSRFLPKNCLAVMSVSLGESSVSAQFLSSAMNRLTTINYR